MKTYKCLFYIGECEMVIELRATTWQAVEDAAEKLAKKLDAKYDYCVEEGEEL